jgi:hypothetical protein
MGKAAGAGKTSFDVVAGTTDFKLQQAMNEKDMAASRVLDNVSGPLGNVATKAADLAREFPVLTTAAFAAATTLSALAASAGVLAGGRMLFGGGAAAIGAGASGAAGAAGAALGRGKVRGRFMGGLGRRAGVLAALGFSAVDAIGTEMDSGLSRNEKNAAHMGTAGGAAGAWAGATMGAKAGAAIGTAFAPGLGTAIGGIGGGLVGGALGYWGGHSLGKKAGEVMFGGNETVVRNEIKLIADGRELAAVVNEVNSRQAQRH